MDVTLSLIYVLLCICIHPCKKIFIIIIIIFVDSTSPSNAPAFSRLSHVSSLAPASELYSEYIVSSHHAIDAIQTIIKNKPLLKEIDGVLLVRIIRKKGDITYLVDINGRLLEIYDACCNVFYCIYINMFVYI